MPQSSPSAAATASDMDKNSGSNSSSASSGSSKGQQPPRSASAGPAGESKPKSDGKNSNGSKRYNRKREPSYPKNENFSNQSRRSNSQKSKTFNKMPPQRGGGSSKPFSSSSNGGRRDEVWSLRMASAELFVRGREREEEQAPRLFRAAGGEPDPEPWPPFPPLRAVKTLVMVKK